MTRFSEKQFTKDESKSPIKILGYAPKHFLTNPRSKENNISYLYWSGFF